MATTDTVQAAATEAVQAASVAGSVAVHDLSMWGMFIQANFTVKLVIIGLLAASVWSWAIIFDKYKKFKAIKAKSYKFEKAFWESGALDQFYEKVKKRSDHPMAVVFLAAMQEWYRSRVKDLSKIDSTMKLGIKERIGQIMGVARNKELEKLEKHLGFLATVGSTAPFVGLFGTVWGIMNSFQSIAISKNTTLAVVAPGIAEALFATAIGLIAAIPAVVAYNKFSVELGRLAGKLEDFSGEFTALLSRQLDSGKA